MQFFSTKIRYLLAAVLAGLIFLNTELGTNHIWHIVIGVLIVVFAALGVNKSET